MRIVMVCYHDPAGCMYQLMRAINEHTKHEARCIRMADLGWGFPYDLDYNSIDREECLKVVEDADVLHFASCSTGYFGGAFSRFSHDDGKFIDCLAAPVHWPNCPYGLQELPLWADYLEGKKVFVHWHGDMLIRSRPELFQDYMRDHPDYGFFVSTIDLLKHVPGATYIPNIVPIYDEAYQPLFIPDHLTRIWYTAYSYSLKSREEFAWAADKLAHKHHTVKIRMLSNSVHSDGMRYRRGGDVHFDNMFFDSYGVSALEAMSMGQVVVMKLDDFFLKHFAKYFEGPHPFVLAYDKETLLLALDALVSDREMRIKKREYARGFMDREMNPEKLVKFLVDGYGKT